MTLSPSIAQQTLSAVGAFAITAALLFGSFAPPAPSADHTVAIVEVA
jgi:hypothetical protein